MFAEQTADGGWRWLDFDLAPFESADARVFGAALAAIAVGRAGGADTHRAGRKALLGFIARAKQGELQLHDKLVLVWASRHLDGVLTTEEVNEYAAAVRAVQRVDGGFSLADLGTWRRRDGGGNRPDASDGYATAFAAFVLAQLEDPDDAAAAATARCWLVGHQTANGAWLGRSMNRDARFNRDLMSDAATAFAVLALEAALTVARGSGPATVPCEQRHDLDLLSRDR
jgi:hypothetical protein